MAQEPKRISRCSIFVKGRKVGTAESGDYTINDNGEDHVTDDGWTMSDGTTTCEVKLNTIVAVDGATRFLKDALIAKQFVTLQLSLIDGETHTITARNVTDATNWDNKTGGMKGSVTFRGGEPTRN
jgi:hypothetical protein